jgi:hypothetical protein
VPAPDQSCPAAAGNLVTGLDDECSCIASNCMAWRWVDEVDEIHGTVATTKRIRGFCGLAGRP